MEDASPYPPSASAPASSQPSPLAHMATSPPAYWEAMRGVGYWWELFGEADHLVTKKHKGAVPPSIPSRPTPAEKEAKEDQLVAMLLLRLYNPISRKKVRR